ncbi:hypothetical protein K503DRAFT_777264, partial [Rhizopogon vinicolor AM-OR11-026]
APLQPTFIIDVHDKGVNYINFYPGSDNHCLVTTGDDHVIKVSDLNKSCVQKMEGHMNYRTKASPYSTCPASSVAAKTAL